jgi:cytoskeletal protein CcmA (bactofilin family)
MLGNNKRSRATVAGSTTLVSPDTCITGDIRFSGNLEIEGEVKGSVIAEPGQESMVRVAEAGRVEGEIRAPSVMINGAVEGSVHAGKHLELAPRARVQGDVYYALLEMAAGSEVNGRLIHVGKEQSLALMHHDDRDADAPVPHLTALMASATKVD